MDNLLKFILENIVKNPESIEIESVEQSGDEILYKVTLAQDDKGIVIGKGGKNIQSIRNLLNIAARNQNKRIFIKIED
ncbi:MAG TPA: KH domain-containing protein [Candidatus Dojkabacteria bacterium]|jgi:hypothetical protein